MSGQRPRPVVCFSYLAAAELWKVARFPLANYGAEVVSAEHSVAADAPMAAAVLTALDTPTLLLSNSVGNDIRGAEVQRWLQRHQVATAVEVASELATPQIVVVADESGTRTWFPYLPGVVDRLATLDLSPLNDASFAYIDCYQLIEAPAVRAIHAARAAGIPLMLNLGGSPLSALVVAAVRGYPGLIVQSNVDDDRHAEALTVAASILAATDAEWVVITAGTYGAVAVSRTEPLSVPAFRAVVRHTHCAGAAFSGGLLYGLLEGWPMADSLTLASASGALRCERSHQEPMPTLTELRSFVESREYMVAAA
jgi:sugar/nucleoside kinase (ribokinase family)